MRFFLHFDAARRWAAARYFVFFCVFASTVAAFTFAQEPREWRNLEGRPIIVGGRNLVGTLDLKNDNDLTKARIRVGSKAYRYPLAKLSAADRAYVEAERAKKAAAETSSTKSKTPSTKTRAGAAASRSVSEASSPRALPTISENGVKRALLVGVDDYAELADLLFAVADVEAIRERLIELGFEPENIVEMKSTSPAGMRPTQRRVFRQIDALFEETGPDDLLFLHFSGHGFQFDDAVFFAPEDAVATRDENVVDAKTLISLTEIIGRLTAADAKFKWLIVDACRDNPTGTRSAAVNAIALKNINPAPGVLTLQSCAESERSYEDPETGHGLFTSRLLEAFDGKADFDGDGVMSALDVCKYVSEQTLAASKRRFAATQTPYFSGEFADFIIAENINVNGLSRDEWARAKTLYDESFALAQAKKFSQAKKQIAAALEIVAPVPETAPEKKLYWERQALIEMLASKATDTPEANAGTVAEEKRKTENADAPFVGSESSAANKSPTSKASVLTTRAKTPIRFDRVVSNAAELVDAVEKAADGDVIALEDNVYQLNRPIFFQKKNLALVGKSGNRDAARIVNNETYTFCLGSGVKLQLSDLTVESKEYKAVDYENDDGFDSLTATRCVFIGASHAVNLKGRCEFTECRVVSTHEEYPHAILVGSQGAGVLIAQDCEISGNVLIYEAKELSTLKNCRIDGAVLVGAETVATRCELVDCEIVGSDASASKGLAVYNSAQATMRGGEIRKNSFAVWGRDECSIALSGVKIFDCATGVCLLSGECRANELTFENVDDPWNVPATLETVTLDGKRITEAD